MPRSARVWTTVLWIAVVSLGSLSVIHFWPTSHLYRGRTVQDWCRAALSDEPEEGLGVLREVMRDDDQIMNRLAAAQAVIAVDSDNRLAQSVLIEGAHHWDPRARQSSAIGFRHIDFAGVEVLRALRDLLADDDSSISKEAFLSLSATEQDRRLVRSLIGPLTRHRKDEVRARARSVIESLDDPSGLMANETEPGRGR